METDGIPDFLLRKNWINGMPPAIHKPLVGTYSILNAYKNCPEQMQRRYIAKDLGPFVETPEMAWGNKVHAAFEHRVGAKKPLPVEMQQWEQFAVPFDAHKVVVEQKLAVTSAGHPCDFWDKLVWFRGKADLVFLQGEKAYLCDWKAGSSKYEDPFELATQAVLLHAKHPHLRKFVGNYIWLKENRVGQMHDLSDTRETWRTICRLMGEIDADRQKGRWEKRKSGLCSWCNVTDCENWRER
jgi:hypothetical protein